MAVPSGLSAQLMTAEESTYGTIVTPDRGYELRSESLVLDIERIECQTVRPDQRMTRTDRWYSGKRAVHGDLVLELGTRGFGRWWKHALGNVVTTQPDSVGNPTVYDHTFTPADLPTGLTVQLGRTDITGTVQPFTYPGCKVIGWKLDCAVDQIALFTPSLVGRDETTATALTTATYPAGLNVMSWAQATLTIGGSPQIVTAVNVTANNNLVADRYFLGSPLRGAPLEGPLRSYSGTLAAEFESLTAYNRFTAGTEATLVLLFQGATISGIYKYQTTLTANVRFDGQTPNITGPGVLQQPLPFKVTDTGSASISVVYRTTDTTP